STVDSVFQIVILGQNEDARLGMNGKQLYVQNLLISWVCTSIFSLLLSLYLDENNYTVCGNFYFPDVVFN
ncbi:MAG: hypothetical protein VB856_02365, partial [Rhodospirillales bacterium]